MARTTRNQWLTPDDETGAAICRPLSIPPAFLSIVSGLLETLTDEWRWQEFGDIAPADCVDAMRTMLDAFYEGCPMTYTPNRYTLDVLDFVKASGTADAFVGDSRFWKAGYYKSVTPANGDNWRSVLPLAAGSYHVAWLGIKDNLSGILQAKIDGVSKGTIDLYSGSAQFNTFATFGPFTLSEDAIVTLDIVVNGKNASSTGYKAGITEILVYP